MFRFFTRRASAASPPSVRRARLTLEALESRYTPSPLGGAIVSAPVGGHTLVAPLNNPAPTTSITLNVAYGSGHTVILSGQVTDPNPAGLVVTFTGVVSGQATTDVNGNYQVNLTASALGSVTATVTGSDGVTQASATASVTDTPPVINGFTAVNEGNNIWNFSGTVTANYAPGLTVTFTGGPSQINGKTAIVGSNDTFSLTVQIVSPNPGSATISAQIQADWWGEASNISYAYITWTGIGNKYHG